MQEKAVQQTTVEGDRVGRIRRMLEGREDDPDLFAPDFVSRTPWDLAVRRSTDGAMSGFDPDSVFSGFQMTVEDVVEDGDTVRARWRLRGEWTGPLPFAPGIKPTGRPVEFTGTHVYRFSGDQIVEQDGEFDVRTASRELLGGLNITCGSENCIGVVQALSRNGTDDSDPG